jgi:hypothetical protein
MVNIFLHEYVGCSGFSKVSCGRAETVYYYLIGGKTCRDLEAGYKERGIGIEKRNCKTRGKTNRVTQTTCSKHSTRKRKQWGRNIQPQRSEARVLALIGVPALICVLLDLATEVRAGMIFYAFGLRLISWKRTRYRRKSSTDILISTRVCMARKSGKYVRRQKSAKVLRISWLQPRLRKPKMVKRYGMYLVRIGQ